MPNLLNLMQASAYSLSAQTILPSATLPSHASMLTGYCPSIHGVDWNDYIPENGYAIGTDLFDIAHAAGLETWMFVGKRKLEQLTEPASLTGFEYVNDRDKLIAEELIAEFPADFDVLFVHFATTDAMGHEYGWLSPEQLSDRRRLLTEIDRLKQGVVGERLAAADTASQRAFDVLTSAPCGRSPTVKPMSRRPPSMTP